MKKLGLILAVVLPFVATGQSVQRISMPGSPIGAAWGFLYGCGGFPAENFLPEVRHLGGGFSKIYLLWSQIEMEKGKYDWTATDTYVKQLKNPDEGLISLFSSSMWATKTPALILPPSPAKNPDEYYQFVNTMVKRYKGKVRYWQNDSEPSNPIYWSGTKEQFVDQLKVFYRAVHDADPAAQVVCGGYDGLFNPPPLPPTPMQKVGLEFFDYVLKEGKGAFDVFDLRLYANPYTIVDRVKIMREKMAANGYEKPIIATEYGGPGFFEYSVNRKYVSMMMASTQALAKPKADGTPGTTTGSPIADLYNNMSSLAPETQMFMMGTTPELEAKFERIQVRDLVMRNLFGLSAGVQKMLYWDLWDKPGDRDNVMTLMYGKVRMVDYVDHKVTKEMPVALAFKRLANVLNGVTSVRRIPLPEQPSIFLFLVERKGLGPIYVVWNQQDNFKGEDQPDVSLNIGWASNAALATDAFGKAVPTRAGNKSLRLSVGVTPIYVSPARL